MKLFYSTASPYVRKVMVLLCEVGLDDRVERVPAIVNPVRRELNVARHNPTGHIPTLLLDNGEVLFDSRVICEYLDSLHTHPQMHPGDFQARIRMQTLHALADGILDAAVLVRFEQALRPEQFRWPEWIDGQWDKVMTSLDVLENTWLHYLRTKLDMGVIAVGCALGYLDFRFPDRPWRDSHPGLAAWHAEFAARPSMQRHPQAPMV